MELKRITGEFDLETIYRLDLSNQTLKLLGALLECSSLETLNLSGNNFSDLSAIGALKMLKYLDVSSNQLSSLCGLEVCELLVEVDASGNLISCLEDVSSLSALSHLEAVHLQDRCKGTSNPFCLSAGYADKMLAFLPGIHTLDGERVRGVAEDYYKLCRQVESALDDKKMCPSPATTIPPLSLSKQLKAPSKELEALAAQEAQFHQTLTEIRDLEVRAKIDIEKLEKSLHSLQTTN